MLTEKKVFQYIFLFFFVFLTGNTFLVRASFYNTEGEGVKQNFRIIGENLAGDYALFRLLEQNVPAQEAYQPEKITSFLSENVQAKGNYFSYSFPVKPFLAVPFLQFPYGTFFEMWLFWGIFLFGAALYTFLPLKETLPLMFALPSAFLSFATGGWGVFVAAMVVLALTLSEGYPKMSGFFAALSLIDPIAFVCLFLIFCIRRQKKEATFCLGAGGFILFFTLQRYGVSAFSAAFNAALRRLTEFPADFSSLFSVLLRSGIPLFLALISQILLAISILYFGYKLFLKKNCPPAVQYAYLCAALCLISPFNSLGDYGVFYAGIAFLLYDIKFRGALKGDYIYILLSFLSIYIDFFSFVLTGASIHFILSLGLLRLSYRRSY